MLSERIIKRVLDIVLTGLLLLLMAMQVTKQLVHEWIGIAMLVLVILHHILNRKYYTAISNGKYTPLRVFQLIVNTLLLLTFHLYSLNGNDDERSRNTVYERNTESLSGSSGTSRAVTLVVRFDGHSPPLVVVKDTFVWCSFFRLHLAFLSTS